MDRRQFLRSGLLTVGGAAFLPAVLSGASAHASASLPRRAEPGSYGPLSSTPDANGLLLPEGFTSRVVGVAGDIVEGTTFAWPPRPDGAGTLATDDGGWWYVCNSNVLSVSLVGDGGSGGAAAVRVGPDGTILSASMILESTQSNSGGCITPWGTWLSVEQDVLFDSGRVWECAIDGELDAQALPALGQFAHASVIVDPDDQRLYLTQAHPLGLLYRFTPNVYPDLSDGMLEACVIDTAGAVTWVPVPDPAGQSAKTREQVPQARTFAGGGGIVYAEGAIYFTTSGDDTVHSIDIAEQRYRQVWQGSALAADAEAGTTGNTIVFDSFTKHLIVGEPGAALGLMVVSLDGMATPFARVVAPGHEESYLSGAAFDSGHNRLYVSSTRAPSTKSMGQMVPGLGEDDFGGGVTYEITGPFSGSVPAPTVSTPVTVETTAPSETDPPATTAEPTTVPSPPTTLAAKPNKSGGILGAVLGAGLGAAVIGGALGIVVLRRRRVVQEDPGAVVELAESVAAESSEEPVALVPKPEPVPEPLPEPEPVRAPVVVASEATPAPNVSTQRTVTPRVEQERLATPVVYKEDQSAVADGIPDSTDPRTPFTASADATPSWSSLDDDDDDDDDELDELDDDGDDGDLDDDETPGR